jgi:hypothetical protein
LAFTTSDPAFLSGNEQRKETWLTELKDQIKEKRPIFQDIVVTTLSAKSAQALGTPQGKTELKAELSTRLNQYLSKETHIQDVFFNRVYHSIIAPHLPFGCGRGFSEPL